MAALNTSRDGLFNKAKEIAEFLDEYENKDARKILSIARSLL